MSVFSTEFPVSNELDRAKFIAQIIAWLTGASTSFIFDDVDGHELDGSYAQLKSRTDETLTLREIFQEEGVSAIGFRYDYPSNGLLWRTEGVLRRDSTGENLLKVKTHCIAQTPLTQTWQPKKPYLIKSLLSDKIAGMDGSLPVSDKPIWLDKSGLGLAEEIVEGLATRHLPVVYISAAVGRPTLTKDSIEKLAFDLGGVAHVVVEPSRLFSFALKEKVKGRNVYGGSVGIFLPDIGLQKKFFSLKSSKADIALREAIRSTVLAMRTQMPSLGWDWADLQEMGFRYQRQKDKSKVGHAEMEALYLQEIASKNEQIQELQAELLARPMALPVVEGEGVLDPSLTGFSSIKGHMGPEIYEGEFSDRLLYAVKEFLERGASISIDKRTQAVLSAFVEKTEVSPELSELQDDLQQAAKDPKKVAVRMRQVLKRCGYDIKSESNHVRLEAGSEYIGLESITLPKTPSDHRGLKNLVSDIEKILGTKRLG